MGRTWPNLDAERVPRPGYYWNERLRKLARLGAGEKLPRNEGWVFYAAEGEGSSSQIARRLFDSYPGMTTNEFTYTTTTPLGRRLPIGDHPKRLHPLPAFAAGFVLGAVLTASWGLMVGKSGRAGRS